MHDTARETVRAIIARRYAEEVEFRSRSYPIPQALGAYACR